MKVLIIKNIECEGPGLLKDFLEGNGIGYETVELSLGQKCPSVESFDAAVILGGPMNVYEEDKYPHLTVENELIKEILAREIPFLGFCLGGQLLAKAVGGIVTKNQTKEIGNYEIKLTEAGRRDELFQGFEQVIPVFQWHEDTFSIPDGAVKLAESKVCANQCFKFGKNAYALQFHLEVTKNMLNDWIKEYQEELFAANLDPQDLLREFGEKEETYKRLAYLLFSNFLPVRPPTHLTGPS